MKKNITIILILLSFTVIPAFASDFENYLSTTPFSNYEVVVTSYAIYNTLWLAQHIVPSKDLYLGRISIPIRNMAPTTPTDDNITVEIRYSNPTELKPMANKVNLSHLLTSKTLNTSNTNYYWQDFDFEEIPLLLSGVTYWICAENVSVPGEGYGWLGDSITATMDKSSMCLDEGYNWKGTSGTHVFCHKAYEIIALVNSESHIVAADDGKTKISFEPMPFGSDNYIVLIDTDPAFTSQIIAANVKADNSDDRFFMPVDGTLRDIKVYKGNPLALSHDDFSSDVELTIPYKMYGDYVKDTSPPVREETLAIYWLNEDDSIWVRIPGSVVDTSANTVTAKVNHFSIYTLMGVNETNLSSAYAYPVPFIANSPENHTKIKFIGLSSQATIKVYTLSGELVQTIEEVDGDGSNETLDVDKFSSGVYLYYIFNAEKSKSGQLVIIK